MLMMFMLTWTHTMKNPWGKNYSGNWGPIQPIHILCFFCCNASVLTINYSLLFPISKVEDSVSLDWACRLQKLVHVVWNSRRLQLSGQRTAPPTHPPTTTTWGLQRRRRRRSWVSKEGGGSGSSLLPKSGAGGNAQPLSSKVSIFCNKK